MATDSREVNSGIEGILPGPSAPSAQTEQDIPFVSPISKERQAEIERIVSQRNMPLIEAGIEAYKGDLPRLLSEGRYRQWVAYRGSELVAFSSSYPRLRKRLEKMGFANMGEFFMTIIARRWKSTMPSTLRPDAYPRLPAGIMTILRGPILHNQNLAVLSGRVDLRPPKIIVGVSLTLLSERESLPEGSVTLPAILDTGLNRTFEIDEWHLIHWAGIHKEFLNTAARDEVREGRKYDLCHASRWLHRMPSVGPRQFRERAPILLKNSIQVRVMATTGRPDPRLPLLGLNALIQNNLQVRIDGENSRFRIFRSYKSTLSSFFRSPQNLGP